MFFELRQYSIKDGQMDEWVEFMEKEIIPYQVAKGMVILGSFVGDEEKNLYIWIRRFESESEKDRLNKAVYEDSHWTKNLSPKVGELMHRDWSTKAIQRLLLQSATYQQSASVSNRMAATLDTDNRLLSLMPRRRLSAEELRDSMLSVS